MKKPHGNLKLILFILPVILLLVSNSFKEPGISDRVLGKWQYALYLNRGVGRYGQKEVDAIKTSVLNFDKDKIYFNDVTFIDTCFYMDLQSMPFFERENKEPSFFLDGPLAIKYSEDQLSKFIRLDFNCQQNGFGTFYLNGDTLILNSTGGISFFFTKVKPSPTRLFAEEQERELLDGQGFLSYFSKIEEGSFKGQVSGILKIVSAKGDTLSADYISEPAFLSIVHDPAEVYDVSFKNYQVERLGKQVQVNYQIYAFANEFLVRLDGKTYKLGGIDGGCDLVINGLNYEYTSNDKSEYLLLHFTKDVGLRVDGKGQGPAIIIKRGSMLMFGIHR